MVHRFAHPDTPSPSASWSQPYTGTCSVLSLSSTHLCLPSPLPSDLVTTLQVERVRSTGPEHLLFPLYHPIADENAGDASTHGVIRATASTTAESGGSSAKEGGSQGLREGEEGEGEECVGVAGMHERQLKVCAGEVTAIKERAKVSNA